MIQCNHGPLHSVYKHSKPVKEINNINLQDKLLQSYHSLFDTGNSDVGIDHSWVNTDRYLLPLDTGNTTW